MREYKFLLVNLGVIMLLLFLFLRKNRQTPSKLNLSAKKVPTKNSSETSERSLNCMFQYNGHTWDAHEILGVPAGAPGEAIRAGYEAALKSAKDEQSKHFIEAALSALRDKGQI